MDGSSVMWMYHSHVDDVRDINTGLFGPMIVTARAMARADGTPVDVDREFVACPDLGIARPTAPSSPCDAL
jgi:hephaestin